MYTSLLIVDSQVDFCAPRGALSVAGAGAGDADGGRD